MGTEVIKKILLGISLLGIVLAETNQAAPSSGTTFTPEAVSTLLRNIITAIKGVAAVLAIAMFVVGGILYAIGNMLTGGMKQSAHGWAQGLIIGAIVAIILIIIAEPLVYAIANAFGLPLPS
jgi:acyl-CoA synthetase (AMP-forming)/AMP-acid ligase II